MTWDFTSGEMIRFAILIISILILAGIVLSAEMKRRNKIIFAVICIALLLSIPFTRRMEIQKYTEEEGYSLIVSEPKVLLYRYYEVGAKEFLWSHVFFSFSVNHENKLVFIERSVYSPNPWTLEEIEFFAEEE